MSARTWGEILLSCFLAGAIVALGIIISALTEGKMPSQTQAWLAASLGLLAACKDLQSRLAQPPGPRPAPPHDPDRDTPARAGGS